MTDLYDLILQEVTALIDAVQEARRDGKLTWNEALGLLGRFVAAVVRLLEKWNGYTGSAKKEAALKAVELFYDRVIAPLDIPGVPEPLESLVVDPALKRVLLQVAAGLIDTLVAYFNRQGWPADDIPPEAWY